MTNQVSPHVHMRTVTSVAWDKRPTLSVAMAQHQTTLHRHHTRTNNNGRTGPAPATLVHRAILQDPEAKQRAWAVQEAEVTSVCGHEGSFTQQGGDRYRVFAPRIRPPWLNGGGLATSPTSRTNAWRKRGKGPHSRFRSTGAVKVAPGGRVCACRGEEPTSTHTHTRRRRRRHLAHECPPALPRPFPELPSSCLAVGCSA